MSQYTTKICHLTDRLNF